jgi:hypothetical protein
MPPMDVVRNLLADQAKAKSSPFFESGRATGSSAILDSIGGGTASPTIQQFFRIGSGGLFTPSAVSEALISSPPRYKGSDNRNLYKYIAWLIQKRPT